MASAPATLRTLLLEPGIVVAPGAADALTAKLVEAAGFTAVYCTGGGISRSMGFPDVGYVTLSEMVGRVRNIAEVCNLPLVADVDAGFGNVLTLMRAVRTFEAAGASAIHVEDKEVPHRTRDSRANLVDAEEMTGRVRAAIQARSNPEFVIIARTDVLPILGLDAAIERANRYADAGADVVYVEHLKTRADMEVVAKRVSAPKLISLNKGEGELVPADALGEMGYKILTLPADAQLAAIHNMKALLEHLKESGSMEKFDAMVTFPDRDALVGLADVRAIEEVFLP
jgi:2-methylisocitrate lyase-like PEP mutase family enzyme